MYIEVLRDLVAIVAADDAPETRTVYAVVVALGVIGVALVVLAVWLVKQTRPDRELLAPLERMNDRAWRKQEPAQMRRDLDEVRPTDARPVVRGQDLPEVDDEFAQSRPALATFGDLQAQLAADARSHSSGDLSPDTDPLLTVSAASAPDADVANNGAADSDQDSDTVDHSDLADELAGGPGLPVDLDDDVADGTVTHTGAGSAEIAALVAPAGGRATDDTGDDPYADDDEPASTESAD